MPARAQIALVVSFSKPTSPKSCPAASSSFPYVSRDFSLVGGSRRGRSRRGDFFSVFFSVSLGAGDFRATRGFFAGKGHPF